MADMLEQYRKSVLETAENLRIIDDAMFRLVAEKQDVCQEILRTLLDMPGLIVKEVKAQSVMTSLHREITLDALCLLEDGSISNIEMQKSNIEDDIKRVRFHASSVTTNRTPKGTDFVDVPNIKILYISEYDVLKTDMPVTKVKRCKYCNGQYIPLDDGEEIYFANTKAKDETNKTDLLQLMLKTDAFTDARFPAISAAVNYFKKSKGGKDEMCKAIEELNKKTDDMIAELTKELAESKSALAEKDDIINELLSKLSALQ